MLRTCTDDEQKEILDIIARNRDVAPTTIDRAAIERALAASSNHIGRTADALGVSRRTLQKRMREYDMPAGASGRKSRFA